MSDVVELVVEPTVVAARRFPPHSHDEFVLSVNGRRTRRERVRLDTLRFDVGAGETTAYNPGQVQASTTETADDQAWVCLSLHVPAPVMAAVTGHGASEFARPVLTNRRIGAALHRSAAATDAEQAREWAIWAVAEAATPTRATEVPGSGRSTLVARAVEILGADLTRPVALDGLADRLGVGLDAMARAFVAEVGVPPYAWHLQERLREGRRRLRTGHRPAEVAHALGFSDQAHFHRHYAAAYARTPGADRRATPDRSRREGTRY